ncbi:MAG: hypothetical protein GY851_29315 [bacterium]|nr:hypothetical protein [bacterium]
MSLRLVVGLLSLGAAATAAEEVDSDSLRAVYDAETRFVDVSDRGTPVLRYSQGTTPVPEGVDPAFARGDYVCALYGLDGELMTEDFPSDHVHHRAVNWAWATVEWNGETRDMFAVRNPYTGPVTGGLWARPVEVPTIENPSDSVVIRSHCRWMWDDSEKVVDEVATIRVYRQSSLGRAVDFDIVLTPVVDGLRFCGRIEAAYSGFNIRMATGKGQRIALYTDPVEAADRRAWADYTAQFPGGSGRSGVALLQHASNPGHPQEWREYPTLNFFQPIHPGGALVPMPKGVPIRLRYRLVIHRGDLTEDQLAEEWRGFQDEK